VLAVHLLLHGCQEALHVAAAASNKHITSRTLSAQFQRILHVAGMKQSGAEVFGA
jgi:hypothetical protein